MILTPVYYIIPLRALTSSVTVLLKYVSARHLTYWYRAGGWDRSILVQGCRETANHWHNYTPDYDIILKYIDVKFHRKKYDLWLWYTSEPIVLFIGCNSTGIWLCTLIRLDIHFINSVVYWRYDGPWVTWRGQVSVAVPQCLACTSPVRHYCLEPLPMDRLIIHDAESVRAWHSTDRDQLLAVAHRDLHVAHRDLHVTRRNVADLTRYLDDQAAQLAVYMDAGENDIPLMTVKTFPRLTGSVRAVLDDTQHWTVYPIQGVIYFRWPGTFVNRNVMFVCPVISELYPDSSQGDYWLPEPGTYII